ENPIEADFKSLPSENQIELAIKILRAKLKEANEFEHLRIYDLAFANWEVMNLYEPLSTDPYYITNSDEGKSFEVAIPGVFLRHFPANVHSSPFFEKGKELTDVLAFDDNFICIVQAKTISALNATNETSRTLGRQMRKDIDAKLKQCRGTVRNIRSGRQIFTDNFCTNTLAINNQTNLMIHAIVVISEMHHSVNWRIVADKLIELSDPDRQIYYHVCDLQEISNLSNGTRASGEFVYSLITRWNTVKENRNGFVRFGGLGLSQE
ncbi:MAG: hypothetical protein KC546_19505, partial [Anaerolineae bacterium]|nr:hypothetical protein [Anaerolineae bacterium]